MKNVIKGLEGIAEKTGAGGAILFAIKNGSRIELASWYKKPESKTRIVSVCSFAIRDYGYFYGALCLIEPACPIHAAWGFIKSEQEGLMRALEPYKKKTDFGRRFIAQSTAMRQLAENVKKVADSKAPVLLLGESGTGKTEVARVIHEIGPFRNKPFLALHCTNIPPTLFEAELFGHTKGAFTGATESKKGLVELAKGGSLFLDEIGELPGEIQAKLLRYVETGDFFQVGGRQLKRMKARIICATSKDLEEMMKQGLFRPEFFYRLAGLKIRVPSLEERREEIPVLAEYFLKRACHESDIEYKKLSPDAEKMLKRASFPGNVRELANLMESVAAFVDEQVVTASHLKRLEFDGQKRIGDLNLERARQQLEEKLIRQALAQYKTVDEAAKALGIDRRSLWRKRKTLDL
ncbi:sigma-54-dependent Fis family transcriptional regulator [candidate division WOR-3 bacterium]|nr:sigma-54-dependent Fis family transcriptional regulator [candidate division WOR-3 bacterium]